MPREGFMKRVPFSSAATLAALLGLLLFGSPAATAAQGARQRGAAPAQGQAAPRGQTQQAQQAQPAGQGSVAQGGRQAVAQPQRAPQPQRSIEPLRSAPQQRVAPRAVQPSLGTAVPRAIPRGVSPNHDNQVYRPNYQPNYRPAYRPSYGPSYRPVYPAYRPVYRPYYNAYYRPYYTFQPRLHVRFGLWVGVPVAYPYYMYPAASYPYAYTYPQPIYPTAGAVAASGAINAAGGLSFDINPSDARIFVDLQYMGIAAQFLPTEPPLSLAPGRHHVEIQASGFEVIAFDVDIAPGQVIPYQGDLQQF